MSGIRPPRLTLKVGDAALHLLLLNLPRVPIALMSVPFCLQESHDALEGVLGGLGDVGAIALHHRSHLQAAHAVASIRAHRGAPLSIGRVHGDSTRFGRYGDGGERVPVSKSDKLGAVDGV